MSKPRKSIKFVDMELPFEVYQTPRGTAYDMPLLNGERVLTPGYLQAVAGKWDVKVFVCEVNKECDQR